MSGTATATAADEVKPDEEKNGVVTEEDLLKSLQALEGKVVEEEEEEPETTIQAGADLDNFGATIDTLGSENLHKALDASDALQEIVSLIGLHVDSAMEAMNKSLQAAAERDHATVGVLEKLAKSIDDIGEKIETYGAAPAGKARSSAAADGSTEVLEKGAGSGAVDGGEGPPATMEEKIKILRPRIAAGLEMLVKSAEAGSLEQNGYLQAAVMFDATGKIDPVNFQQAMAATKDMPST